jgi:hypothetical protein
MVDEEVEIVLREIRERVISQARAEQIQSVSTPAESNGDSAAAMISREEGESANEALARMNSYLTTTARAWDRLPPVISNRAGAKARLELWLKTRFKSLARWFTWEQVNFNAAVHHALSDTLKALSDHERAIAALRKQLQSEADTRQAEIRKQTDALRAELRTEVENRRIELQNQRTETNTLRAELRGESEARRIQIEDHQNDLRAAIEAQQTHGEKRLSQLADELREREDQLENEQRVCFKQISLEAGESAVFQERSQRKIESALEELRQRVKQLEESVKRGK